MKEFILNGESPPCFGKWRKWERGFVKENFGLEMKDYELVASLRDAESHRENHVKFMKDDGTVVDITLEKYHIIPKNLWLANY
jgi:argininosuccinate synthase